MVGIKNEEAQGGATKARARGIEEEANVDEAEMEEVAKWNEEMSKTEEVWETAFGEVGALEPATEHSEDCQDEWEVAEECSSLAVQFPFDELEASFEMVPLSGKLVDLDESGIDGSIDKSLVLPDGTPRFNEGEEEDQPNSSVATTLFTTDEELDAIRLLK